MAIHSVNEATSLINRQMAFQEKIEMCLWKLEALIAAVLSGDFYKLSDFILHNYFSVASDLVEQAARANQESLSNLHKYQDVI